MNTKNQAWTWGMSVGEVSVECGGNVQEINAWHNLLLSIKTGASIQKLLIDDLSQDLDIDEKKTSIVSMLILEITIEDNTYMVTVVLFDEIELLNAFIRFDYDLVSRDLVHEYFRK